MRLAAICLAFLAASAPALGAMPPEKIHETCTRFARNASTISLIRQNGVPMSIMMEEIKEAPGADVVRRLVLSAFEVPIAGDDESRRLATQQFGEKHYEICYRDLARQ